MGAAHTLTAFVASSPLERQRLCAPFLFLLSSTFFLSACAAASAIAVTARRRNAHFKSSELVYFPTETLPWLQRFTSVSPFEKYVEHALFRVERKSKGNTQLLPLFSKVKERRWKKTGTSVMTVLIVAACVKYRYA